LGLQPYSTTASQGRLFLTQDWSFLSSTLSI
jgi:hypothetical protein